MSTADERAEWKALAEAATDGPWEHVGSHVIIANGEVPTIVGDVDTLDDQRFIAAARTAVPSLLAEVERAVKAEADLKRLREGLEALAEDLMARGDHVWALAEEEDGSAVYQARLRGKSQGLHIARNCLRALLDGDA